MKKLLFISLALISILPLHTEAQITSNLSVGLRNNAQVRELQQFLTDQGVYKGPVNGNFFALTQAAVKSFQAREGIARTGTVGPLTRGRIQALLKTSGVSDRTSLQAQIDALQAALKNILAQATSSSALPVQSIPARAIVGLNCYFRYGPTGEIINVGKGSGVIVKSDGTVLTARHVVDPAFSYSVDPNSETQDIARNAQFDHCNVGIVPSGTVLPAPEDIRRVNPSTVLPVLAYRANLVYIPGNINMSGIEANNLDFAVLKITGLSSDAPIFGVNSLPSSFDYVQVLTAEAPREGEEVITYGYPGDVGAARSTSFTTFFLTGSVGTVKSVLVGDSRFRNIPLTLNTNLEVRSGRSGSPLFYKGYLVGIITAHAVSNVTDSYSVSTRAIADILRGTPFAL